MFLDIAETGADLSGCNAKVLKDYNGISADAFVSGDLVFYGGEAFLGAYKLRGKQLPLMRCSDERIRGSILFYTGSFPNYGKQCPAAR